ncbi:MAG: Acyl carrier protein [Deltaproteobacteria bacterium]|nr:Acyl carrier protein [Deltaproteobacteria bacterium]
MIGLGRFCDCMKVRYRPTNLKMTISGQVREFITSNFYVPHPQALADTASLLEAGVIDSTGVLEIITFLESRFGLKVNDDEVVPDNLDSIERIAEFVARKKAGSGGV